MARLLRRRARLRRLGSIVAIVGIVAIVAILAATPSAFAQGDGTPLTTHVMVVRHAEDVSVNAPNTDLDPDAGGAGIGVTRAERLVAARIRERDDLFIVTISPAPGETQLTLDSF